MAKVTQGRKGNTELTNIAISMWGKNCCVICVWRFYVYVRHDNVHNVHLLWKTINRSAWVLAHLSVLFFDVIIKALTKQHWLFFFVPWFLTHEKHSSFLRRSKRAESGAGGRINYPGQAFPLSSLSDTPDKSGPYQRPKGPSASQAIFLRFTLPSTAHFLSPSYYPFTPFHMILSI